MYKKIDEQVCEFLSRGDEQMLELHDVYESIPAHLRAQMIQHVKNAMIGDNAMLVDNVFVDISYIYKNRTLRIKNHFSVRFLRLITHFALEFQEIHQ